MNDLIPYGVSVLLALVIFILARHFWKSFAEARKWVQQELTRTGTASVQQFKLEAEAEKLVEDRRSQETRIEQPGGRAPSDSEKYLPLELLSATGRWDEMQRAFRYPPAHAPKYIIARCVYTPIAAVEALQERLVDCAKRTFGEPEDFDTGQHFDAVRRPEIAICNETLYTFPFFLSWQRRHTWGVIPYGSHQAVGLLIHQDHKAYRELKLFDKTDNWAAPDPTVGDPWITTLLHHIGIADGRLYSVAGYLHQELIPLAILRTGSDKTQSLFLKYGKPVQPSDLGSGGVFPRLLEEKRSRKDAMIVDLAEVHAMPQQLQTQGYRVLTLKHDLYVPVGIGFSLLMAPQLLKDNRWSALAAIARDVLSSPVLPDQFHRAGIELDLAALAPRMPLAPA